MNKYTPEWEETMGGLMGDFVTKESSFKISEEAKAVLNELTKANKELSEQALSGIEDQLVYENKNVRIFDTTNPLHYDLYFSPNQGISCPAIIAYNDKYKQISLCLRDGGYELNAREIMQDVWGPWAGGTDEFAQSPENVRMTKDDIATLVNELTERQLKLKTEIEPHEFEGNYMLSSLSIPDNIEKIGNDAFRGCSNLSELLINDELLANIDIDNVFADTNLDLDAMHEIANEYRDQEFDISDEDNSTENEDFGEL